MSVIDELYNAELSCFDHPWTRKMLADELCSPQTIIETARHNGKITGFALGRTVADEGELLKICVLAENRGRGLAVGMLESILKQMRERGAFACYLEVNSANFPAISLYGKAGFVQVGLRKNYYPNGDALVMKIELR